MKKLPIALLIAASAFLAGAAHGQEAGTFSVKLGWNKIMPKVRSGDLSPPSLPDSKIDIRSASALYFTGAYMLTDAIALEALAGLPYKHTVVGAGSAAGAGRIGSIHQVSPTLLLEYRFLEAAAPLRPYLGAGVTYAKFYKTEGSAALTAVTNAGGPPTTIGGDHEWGGTVAAGLRYRIDSHWFLDAAAFKTWIKTEAPLSTGQGIKANLDPVSLNASIGYTF
jgi:outer membrane protein